MDRVTDHADTWNEVVSRRHTTIKFGSSGFLVGSTG